MRKFTKMMLTLALLFGAVGGVSSIKAENVRFKSAGFDNKDGGKCSWDSENKVYSWQEGSNNTIQMFSFEAGVLSKFSKLHIKLTSLTVGASVRVLFRCQSGGNYQAYIDTNYDDDLDLLSDFDHQWGWGKPTAEDIAAATEIRIGGNSAPTAEELAADASAAHSMTIKPSDIYLEADYEVLSIATSSDWLTFSKMVKSGVSPLNAQLTADIEVTDGSMIGVGSSGRGADNTKAYSGSFDGQNHTITYSSPKTTEQVTAPFRFVKDATIQNLKTAGSMSSESNILGGIVGFAQGAVTINNCSSSMNISTDVTGSDATIGGILGLQDQDPTTLNVTNCLYTGVLTGDHGISGIAGYMRNGGGATFKYILYAGSYVTENVNPSNMENIVRGGGELTKCYYVNRIAGSTNGTEATSAKLASGEVTYDLQNSQATQYWGQNFEEPSSIPMLTNNAAYKVFDLGGGEYANWNNTISNDADWIKFSKIVETGTTDVDVTMTADVNAGSRMVGTDSYPYSGTFDGQGHTVNFTYSGDGSVIAPFKVVNGATIKDLITTGSITSSNNLLAGIVGQVNGSTSLIRCASNMSIKTTVGSNGRIGGLVARNANTGSSLWLSNCMYDGAINSSTNQAAGFVGWSPNTTTISNCLVASASKNITGGESNFAPNAITIPSGKYALYLNKFGSSDQGTQINEAQRYSGYVAYTLSSDITEGTLFFGQGNLNSSLVDNAPALTSNTSKKVVGKTPEYTGTMVYMNPGGAVPNAVRLKALGWYFDENESHVATTVPVDINNETVLRRTLKYFKLAVGAAGATTLAVPFSTTSLPDGVKAYDLTIEDAAVKATRVYKLTANKPVLINAPQGEYLFSAETTGLSDLEMETGDNAWINYAALSDPINGALTGVYNCKYGDYSAVSFVPQNKYVLQNGASGLGFYKVEAENTIKITSFRAYLTTDIIARSLEIVFDEDPTGINKVTAKKTEENGAYFNLAGQRVAQPTKGLYIVNGKKVVIK